jgi:hypothetical protein
LVHSICGVCAKRQEPRSEARSKKIEELICGASVVWSVF